MHSRPSITIMIPSYNEEVTLASCIRSCLTQTRPADQIIVINDGSTDRTRKILSHFLDLITFVTLPEATGNKSYAQQFGLKFVTSDIFITTDADTILDRNFVANIERTFIENPETAAVAGYVCSTQFNYLTALREIDYVLGQDLYKHAQSFVNFLMVIPGCAGAFRTDLFKKNVVTIDHDTLTEDLDFTYKLHELGLKVRYEPKAIVYTQDPHTLHSYIYQMRRWFGGGWQNLKKHYRIMFRSPGAALHLSMSYLEGMVFSILFFALPFINFVYFVNFLLLLLTISIITGLYAGIRRRRVDLIAYSPLLVLLRAINAWIFVDEFINEIILRRNRRAWFTPERRQEQVRVIKSA